MKNPCTNRLVVDKTDSAFKTHFGMPYAVAPMQHVSGLGHEERLMISCYGGMCLEVSRAFATELARRLPEAIACMPFLVDDVHDACLDQEEG
jgi:hypothetical protein